jgi:hypothetical protein
VIVLVTNFDRVRPRRADAATAPPPPAGLDAEGKRALFTKASEVTQPRIGSAVIECSRCKARSVLGPLQAIRAAIPSIHLGLRFGRGDDVRSVGLVRDDYQTYLKCPSCGRPSWVRFTLQV